MNNKTTGLTEHGERIAPIHGDPPCSDYDPAGPGAGTEYDGEPQCANCGWAKTDHSPDAVRVFDLQRERDEARAIALKCSLTNDYVQSVLAAQDERAAQLNAAEARVTELERIGRAFLSAYENTTETGFRERCEAIDRLRAALPKGARARAAHAQSLLRKGAG